MLPSLNLHPPPTTTAAHDVSLATDPPHLVVVTKGTSSLTHLQPTLLNETVACTISKVSTATRFSIRCLAFVFDSLVQAAKFSTATSLAISRQAFISALSSARSSTQLVRLADDSRQLAVHEYHEDELSFQSVMHKYTTLGIYFINHTFSLAELFTMTTFHLTSSTIKFSLNASEETVRVLDGLFGSTETSRALAAIVDIVRREIMASDGHASPNDAGPFGAFSSASKLVMVGAVTKAVTAFACLQKLTYPRKLALLTIDPIFEFTVDYDRIHSCDHDNVGDDDSTSEDPVVPIWVTPDPAPDPTEVCIEDEGVVQLSGDENQDVRTITTISELNRDDDSSLEGQAPFFQAQQTKPRNNPRTFTPRPNLNPRISPSPLTHPTHIYPPHPLVKNLKRYMQYSTGAYGKQFMRIFGIGQAPLSVVGDVNHPYHHAFANHVGIPVSDVILSSFQIPKRGYLSQAEQINAHHRNFFNPSTILNFEAPKIHPLVHYLCIDHENTNLVLTLRGTLGLSDVLTDLTCDYADLSVYTNLADVIHGHSPTPTPNVKKVYQAHAGMVMNAELVANQVGPYIKHVLEEHAGYGLVLCGHSLGGGVAAILALLWSDWFNDEDPPPSGDQVHRTAKSCGLPTGRPLHCYTYGCPCIVSHELSDLSRTLITSVVHGSDVITCLSLGMLHDFKSMSRTMNDSRNRGVAESIITKALGIDKLYKSVDDDWLWSLMQTVRAEMVAEKLYPPGTVYWMRTRAYVRTTTTGPTTTHDRRCFVELHLLRDPTELLGELRFSRSMFTDHNPRFYLDGIRALELGVAGLTAT